MAWRRSSRSTPQVGSHPSASTPTRLTVTSPRLFCVSATVRFGAGTVQTVAWVEVRKSGTSVTELSNSHYGPAGSAMSVHVSGLVALNTSDYIEVFAWAGSSGQAKNMALGGGNTAGGSSGSRWSVFQVS